MASEKSLNRKPIEQMLEQLKDARCVMLGSPVKSQQLQPMSPQIDEEMIEAGDGVIYFYSDNTSDLGRAVLTHPGQDVRLTFQDKDYQISAIGTLDAVTDKDLIDRFWSVHAAAWYPGGKTDPKILMLKFTLDHAQVWASSKNPSKYLYEVTKANLTDTMPDVGTTRRVDAAA